jgi:hypothetical protein
MNDQVSVPVSRGYTAILWLLLFLFVLRVVGQALVAFFDVGFLPAMERWYSGLMPYPWLLLSQIFIILLYGKICVDFTRSRGFFVLPRRRFGLALLMFGALYLGVMLARYGFRMHVYPGERWTGGSIPTFFHWVLAAFLLTLGAYHGTRRAAPHRPEARRSLRPGQRASAWLAVLMALALALSAGRFLASLPPPVLEPPQTPG